MEKDAASESTTSLTVGQNIGLRLTGTLLMIVTIVVSTNKFGDVASTVSDPARGWSLIHGLTLGLFYVFLLAGFVVGLTLTVSPSRSPFTSAGLPGG